MVELSNEPITVVLDTDPDALLRPGGPAKEAEQDRVRGQIREGLRDYTSQRAGMVLTFGTSPRPAEGNWLAAEVNRLLLEEFPDTFGSAVLRNYHTINRDVTRRGTVDVEVYFLVGVP